MVSALNPPLSIERTPEELHRVRSAHSLRVSPWLGEQCPINIILACVACGHGCSSCTFINRSIFSNYYRR